MTKAKMQKKENIDPKEKKVTFAAEIPEAREVFLAGDFNQWDTTALPMKKQGNGLWKKTVALQPGNYEYKFVADGNWRLDSGNEMTCTNCFGTKNNVIRINIE